MMAPFCGGRDFWEHAAEFPRTYAGAERPLENDSERGDPASNAGGTCSREEVLATAFVCRRHDAPRLLVLGNCQAPEIARRLAAVSAFSVMGLEIMTFPEHPDAFDLAITGADVIWSARSFAEAYKPLAKRALSSRFAKPVYEYCPPAFYGVHPDFMHMRVGGKQLPSPAGWFHSRLVVRSFLAGHTPADCLSAICEEGYRALGLFDLFAGSLDELRRREADCDVKLHGFIEERVRNVSLFCTPHHPTGTLIGEVSARICAAMGVQVSAADAALLYPSRFERCCYPIVPCVADRHGLRYGNENMFWTAHGALDWRSFAERSFAIYGGIGGDAVARAIAEPGLSVRQ